MSRNFPRSSSTVSIDTVSRGDAGIELAKAMAASRPSTLVKLLSSARGVDLISFAIGMPAAELFPRQAVDESAARVLAEPGSLQYGIPSQQLRAHVVRLMARRGVECREEQVFLTAGGQQGMDLLTRLLLDPGGEVMVEDLVFEGIRLVLRPLAPRTAVVPTSPVDGIDLGAVERHLENDVRPAFLYTIPEGHNPLGSSMPLENRRRLLDLARYYRMPIIEDDAYGFLSYSSEQPPALRALDADWVLYVGSFSKILAPALRVGWIVAPEEIVSKLSTLKHGSDVDSATFSQRVVADYLSKNDFPAHLEKLRDTYRERCEALAEALEHHAPDDVRWWKPTGGFYIWAELPEGIDATELLQYAIDNERVAFSPGEAFSDEGNERAARSLRLSFAGVPASRMDEGVRRLMRSVDALRSVRLAKAC